MRIQIMKLQKLAVLLALVLCNGAVMAKPETDSEAGINAYIEGLQNAKAVIDKAILDDPLIDDGDSVARAEGYRWAIRMLANRVDRDLGNENNAAYPYVRRCPTLTCKLGWDNPDNTYVTAGPLNPEFSYRVFGKRNTAHLMLLQILNKGGLGGGDLASGRELDVDSDGNWEIILSARQPVGAKNWLKIDEQSERILIRNTFNDWAETEPSILIEVLAGPNVDPPVLTPQIMSRVGNVTGETIPGVMSAFIKIFRALALHDFPTPCTGVLTGCSTNNTEIGGFEDILYTAARYHIPEGKALIIEVPAADAAYRDIQLGNVWTESQDYINRHTSLNSHQDHLDDDGICRYVLSHEDPGYRNWLDVSEHVYGSIMMRWVFADLNHPPKAPQATLVDVEDIGEHMPDSHPRMTKEQRGELMRERRLAVLKRINPAGL
ncbi:MAG: DUF1214 domain-containing protein [Halioglobus sp.]|nr:DUF1214 domain-containing protein [Halioglobus sp.]